MVSAIPLNTENGTTERGVHTHTHSLGDDIITSRICHGIYIGGGVRIRREPDWWRISKSQDYKWSSSNEKLDTNFILDANGKVQCLLLAGCFRTIINFSNVVFQWKMR